MFRFDRSTVVALVGWICVWVLWALLMTQCASAADWRVARAQAIADVVWQHPCGGDVAVTWDTLPPGQDPSAGKAGLTTAAWVMSDERCHVHFPAGVQQDWYTLCTIMIHEYGHVAGLEHSANPHSVMYWMPEPNWRCDDRGGPYLAAHHAV